MKSVEVFISYHQEDEELWKKLETHLASLRRRNIITTWSDRKITPGQDFDAEINTYLKRAGLILLLVSPGFWLQTITGQLKLRER